MFARIGVPMVVLLSSVVLVSGAQGFGIVPGSVTTVALNRDGSVDTQAGSHPYEYTVSFQFEHDAEGAPEGDPRDVEVDLPPGLVGNPLATPRCAHQNFEGTQALCPGNTQVGVLHAEVKGLGTINNPVFNLVPPPGVPARLGLSAAGLRAIEDASVLTGRGYGVAVTSNNIPTPGIVSVTETVWGVPPDKGHDPERQCFNGTVAVVGCSSEATPRPFLTLPSSCTGPLVSTVHADSAQEPGHFVSETGVSRNAGNEPAGLTGCENVPFNAQLSLTPDTTSTESPSGLNVELKIPQPESTEGLAEANLKEAIVQLPAGMTISPSAANGLAACPLNGQEGINLSSSEPAKCPNASKVGTTEIETPLLEHPLKGSVFVAQQGNLPGNGENPFEKTLLAIYLVAEGDGVVAKIPGKIELDKETGQLTARFGGVKDSVTGEEFLPQLPFSDLKMSFFGGAQAPLITPTSCGLYETNATLTPWNGGPPIYSPSTFTISQGCSNGGFNPAFVAGTTNNQAAGFSSFVVTFSRHDGEQRFEHTQITTPPGLLGILKSVVQCPEPEASAESLDACGPQSLLGETTVAAGPGEDPFWVKGGKVYLTGPYENAPFGLKIVVPAVAGPFNLGTEGHPVVVRARIDIDPHTGQVTVTSDPLPTKLQGIPLDIRTVNVTINRPGFMFNPTNCSALSTIGALGSTTGTNIPVASPFQAANCTALPFKPSFTASTQAHTSKANGASLTVNVAQKPGEANIHKVNLQLPLILPARLTTLQKACTDAQFSINPAGCPEASNIGTAIAITPVLKTPLTGPAYLVSHGGAAFPDVEFLLQGEGIQIILDGNTDIKKGITYSKFETIPDAPITSFQTILPEGPHSALAANGNLCNPTTTITTHKKITIKTHGHTKHTTKTTKQTIPQPLQIPTTITAQNNNTTTQNTKITVTNCPKKTISKKHTNTTKHHNNTKTKK